MPITDVVTQNRIRICIACLEQISKVWLVAKMIQNLFESILTEKGFGDSLQGGRGKIHKNNGPLIDQTSHDLGHKNDGMVADSLEKSSERLESQSRALTPALLAHLFAALKSGTSSSSPESGNSLKDGLDINNNTRYQKSSHLTGVTHGEVCNLHLDSQNILPISQQFPERPRSEQLAAQTPVDVYISQYIPQQIPIDHNSEIDTGSQTMAGGNLPVQSLQFPQDQGFMQNMVDRSQYFPSEVGELQHSYPVNEVGYHTTGLYNTSISTTIDQPPAPTGPNVLEWSVNFIHT